MWAVVSGGISNRGAALRRLLDAIRKALTGSRTQAGRQFTVADLERQTEGVVCRKDPGVLDEIPGAYKDIDAVMANQDDLVEVLHTLKQILCVKG